MIQAISRSRGLKGEESKLHCSEAGASRVGHTSNNAAFNTIK